MKITVMTADEQIISLDVDPHETVENVKALLDVEYAPLDLYVTSEDWKMNNIKLYVKSVFITDNCEEFIPEDFRFVKGFVDFHNLPLDTSLEMLQENNVVMPFWENLEQKCIEMLKEIAQNKNDHTK